ncbi:MAG: Gfo/Idh/MocA family protein [Burkholderiales bacterium]
MAALRTGVIGVGYMGRFHAQKLASCRGAKLLAVADADAARVHEVARELGCSPHSDYRRLLDEIDAAIVAVPTELHYRVVRDSLRAGVHVLVEKPLAHSLEEADELLALARRKRLVLQVGHLERFNPAFRAVAKWSTRPLFIDIERLAPYKARGTDVDVVLDLMIHDLDLVLALEAAPVEHVSACGFSVLTDAIDIANARIEFASGCVASVSASRVSQSPVRKLRVIRERGYVSADLQGQRLRTVRKSGSAIRETERSFARTDALLLQAQAFVRAIRARRAPAVGGDEGRRALQLALHVRELVQTRLARYAA